MQHKEPMGHIAYTESIWPMLKEFPNEYSTLWPQHIFHCGLFRVLDMDTGLSADFSVLPD
jgi:hypothetical protein